MKILCYINHYFGHNRYFTGQSSLPLNTTAEEMALRAVSRKKNLEDCIDQLKKLGDIDIKICGMGNNSLVPIDFDFSSIQKNPIFLVYESLTKMADSSDNYDYFINIEDDIFLPKETFQNIVEFDKNSLVNEVILPNRLEKDTEGNNHCVDWSALPGWTQQNKSIQGKSFRVALNPHSGLLILSKEKFKYAISQIDKSFRGITVGTGMESAFAHFHSPFALFRCEDISYHHIYHLDKWMNVIHKTTLPFKERVILFVKILVKDMTPPFLFRSAKFVIGKIFH
ncbi:hypothetical protein LPTSP3_g20940 [Leptospira kobayashii]|uniref:Uncharacterized protein n=1 Tax=Leptospira kobayashii TaxID=1917830 RepID=A0ABM7UK45_9LEPT|nr:hypothetical protein [Leptospira kobayashii]BDA79164.1 hypothetical protein LPTSP3_g20940 [Leptospira kobayashii]